MIQVKISASFAILAALLLSTLTTSCVKEPLSDFNETNVLTLSVTDLNGAAFRAATRTTNDGNIDNVVSTLRVFAFNAISGKKANDGVKVDVRGNTNPKVTMKLKEGEYIFVTVCNETVDLSPALDAVGFRDDLNSMSIGATNFNNTTAIPMVGETARMKVDEAGRVDDGTGKMVYQLTVKVERIAARMDFTVYSAKNDASADEKEVGKIKTLTLTGFPQNIGLMKNGSGYSRTEPGASVTLTGANFTTLPVTAMPDFSADEQAKYTYRAKLTGGRLIVPSHPHATGATPIVVNATFQGADLSYTTDLSGVISYTDGEVTKYAINRNTMYHTKMVGSPMVMRTETTFEDWTVENVDGIVGKTYDLTGLTDQIYAVYQIEYPLGKVEDPILKAKIKFAYDGAPFKFRVVCDELGVSEVIEIDNKEKDLDIPLNATKIYNLITANSGEYQFNPKLADYWGFVMGNRDSYQRVCRLSPEHFKFKIVDITDGNGNSLPSIDMPDCVISRQILYMPYSRSSDNNDRVLGWYFYGTKDFANTAVPSPEIRTLAKAKELCSNLGIGWHLQKSSMQQRYGSPFVGVGSSTADLLGKDRMTYYSWVDNEEDASKSLYKLTVETESFNMNGSTFYQISAPKVYFPGEDGFSGLISELQPNDKVAPLCVRAFSTIDVKITDNVNHSGTLYYDTDNKPLNDQMKFKYEITGGVPPYSFEMRLTWPYGQSKTIKFDGIAAGPHEYIENDVQVTIRPNQDILYGQIYDAVSYEIRNIRDSRQIVSYRTASASFSKYLPLQVADINGYYWLADTGTQQSSALPKGSPREMVYHNYLLHHEHSYWADMNAAPQNWDPCSELSYEGSWRMPTMLEARNNKAQLEASKVMSPGVFYLTNTLLAGSVSLTKHFDNSGFFPSVPSSTVTVSYSILGAFGIGIDGGFDNRVAQTFNYDENYYRNRIPYTDYNPHKGTVICIRIKPTTKKPL